MGEGWRERWVGQPLGVGCVLVAYVAGFAEGTCAHIVDLVRGGFHAYSTFAPVALQVFFISLVFLDPLVVVLVVLVALMRPVGTWLACIAMTVDVPANWFIDWPLLRHDVSWLLRPVGLLPLTLFGIFVLASSVPLRRYLSCRQINCIAQPWKYGSIGDGPLPSGRTVGGGR